MSIFCSVRKDLTIPKFLLPKNNNILQGLKVAVFGGTNGIGQGLSRELVAKGATVTVIGRSFRGDATNDRLKFIQADLSSMSNSLKVAKEIPIETYDMVIFTVGILPKRQREVSSEGIEMDMAVSYLNRYVITKEVAPRLGKNRQPQSAGSAVALVRPRIFNMAFPGNNQSANLEDFNSEKSYSFIKAHENTVSSNEALVLHSVKAFPQVDSFGLNPGMIRTNIRVDSGSFGIFTGIFEKITEWTSPTVEEYSEAMVPLLVNPALEGMSGVMFNAKQQPIKQSKSMTEENVSGIIRESEKLVQRANASTSK